MPSKSLSELVPPVGTEGQPGSADKAQSSTSFPLEQGMSISLWLETVRGNPLLDHRSTPDLPSTADVVIIGSGISGALAALSLLQSPTSPQSVIVLEARELCSGATGRNAGHCKPDMWRGYSKYAEEFGSKQALKILENEMQTWKALNKYVSDNKVDCDLWTGRTLDVMMSNCTARAASQNYSAFVKAGGSTWGVDIEEDPARAEQLSRIKGAKAVYQTHASTLHPWKLVAHVIKTCLELGLNLQTWTPVRSVISAKGGEWTVHTDRGAITTPTVIHTTNAYAGALLPEVIGPINPVPHMCNKVQAPSTFSGSKAIQNSYAVIYPSGAYTINPRQGGGGELLFGGSAINQQKLLDYVAEDPSSRRTNDGLVDFEPITDAVRQLGTQGFEWDHKPGDKGAPVRYERAWSGIIGRSMDEVPFVGEIPGKPGQWISAGHNGHGMARIFTVSPALVKMIQGASWEEAGLPESFKITEGRLRRLLGEKGQQLDRSAARL